MKDLAFIDESTRIVPALKDDDFFDFEGERPLLAVHDGKAVALEARCVLAQRHGAVGPLLALHDVREQGPREKQQVRRSGREFALEQHRAHPGRRGGVH